MTTTQNDTALFDRILNLEDAVRLTAACAAFAPIGTSTYRSTQQAAGTTSDRARLFALVDSMTPEQARAFGAYRVQARMVAA